MKSLVKALNLVVLLLSALYTEAQNRDYTQLKGNNVLTLATSIAEVAHTPYDQITAIYDWTTANLKQPAKHLNKGKGIYKIKEPDEIIKTRTAFNYEYALVVRALCTQLGIPCVIVSGYIRDWKFDDGDTLHSSRYYWNAVSINDEWHLLDCTKGSGYIYAYHTWLQRKIARLQKKTPTGKQKYKFQHEYNDQYLRTDPLDMRVRVISDDPLWQLCDKVLPLEVFIKGEDSVKLFNENSRTAQRNVELDRFASLTIFEQAEQSSSRILEYNPRNKYALSDRYLRMGLRQAQKIIKSKGEEQAEISLQEAQISLKKAKEYLAQAKQQDSKEFAYHRTKNTNKKLHFSEFRQTLDKNNKEIITSLRQKSKAFKVYTAKSKTAAKQVQSAQDKLNNTPAPKVSTAKSDAKSAEALRTKAAIEKRYAELKQKYNVLTAWSARADSLITENNRSLELARTDLERSSGDIKSLLQEKARQRAHLDKEVRVLENSITEYKIKRGDSVTKSWLSHIDTVLLWRTKLSEQYGRLADELIIASQNAQRFEATYSNPNLAEASATAHKNLAEKCLQAKATQAEDALAYLQQNKTDFEAFLTQLNVQQAMIKKSKELELMRYNMTKSLLKKQELGYKLINESDQKSINALSARLKRLAKEIGQ